MITVLVINAIKNIVFELRDQKLLLVKLDKLQGLLHYSAAIHGLCELQDILE